MKSLNEIMNRDGNNENVDFVPQSVLDYNAKCEKELEELRTKTDVGF
ncbi:MAG: hypothetical protein M0R03_20295 [Novosphingobium sp.]|jgi:hypothetical protein|nr:hypothetical protein [Novosphingobium sp.]